MTYLLWDASALAKRYTRETGSSEPCVLVAADHRFVRSAIAEGLPAIDPENFEAADISNFLATL